MPDLPSASGARIAGDDYQHVLTWLHALHLLLQESDVTKIEFEADRAGNVDDLVVHRRHDPALYHQIKFVVDQRTPLTHEWFTTPSKRGGKSPLQRFYDAYKDLPNSKGQPPEMALHTNRLPAPNDAVLKHVSGTDCKLVPRLLAPGSRSQTGRIRDQWADHLGIREEELATFLRNLSIRSGREGLEELEDRCSWAMRAVGYRAEIDAILSAIGALRKLIRTGIRQLDADAIRELAGELNLSAQEPRATLLIQSLMPDPWPESATVSVDWVDLFEGDDASTRRQLHEPSDWNIRLKPDLVAAVDKLRRYQLMAVSIHGSMRLSTGILAGFLLSDVAGFGVASMGREGEWSSDGPRQAMSIAREVIEIRDAEDLAIALAVSQPIAEDVADFVASVDSVGKLIVYTPKDGPSRRAIANPAAGLGLADEISAALRQDTRYGPGTLHLFQACPLPLSIQVGHLWNRMPRTQLYDDLGPGRGYIPTFLI